LLNKVDDNGSLKCIQVCTDAPSINQLLFADDFLVLTKASRVNARTLQNILQLYEMCSGQTINFNKSSVLFSNYTSGAMKREILQKLNINEEDKTDKYLGLPVYVGRSRMKTFEYMKDKVWRRIRGWMEHMLSRTGMDMLIKSCAQAIPTFSCIVLILLDHYVSK
jgi:hypothetical protein